MRDIQMVLERWGAWAANNHEDVTWSSIAAGFKGLIPSKVRSRPQCCDWICPYISRHLLSLNPLLACCRRYSRG
ncbi:antiterminator Q family protein, partial [Escherichia coli]|uniref:antiterminator Q family protein n=2 Tax=Escherichia coli TaxID=562 RepID=UPI0024C404E1